MGRVIFTVFAGRRRFLNVLMTYVHVLLKDGVVDQVPPSRRLARAALRSDGCLALARRSTFGTTAGSTPIAST